MTATLEPFVRALRDCLGDRLVSAVLYGSIAFDDLAPVHGDLDFLRVVDADLDDGTRGLLGEARRPAEALSPGETAAAEPFRRRQARSEALT